MINARRTAVLLCIAAAFFFGGVIIGDRMDSRERWMDGYVSGYKHCEVDFLVEQGAVLIRRK